MFDFITINDVLFVAILALLSFTAYSISRTVAYYRDDTLMRNRGLFLIGFIIVTMLFLVAFYLTVVLGGGAS